MCLGRYMCLLLVCDFANAYNAVLQALAWLDSAGMHERCAMRV